MPREIKKFKEGDVIPQGAQYLRSESEVDYSRPNVSYEVNDRDPLNYIPLIGNLFGTERRVTRYPTVMFHYYAVEIKL